MFNYRDWLTGRTTVINDTSIDPLNQDQDQPNDYGHTPTQPNSNQDQEQDQNLLE